MWPVYLNQILVVLFFSLHGYLVNFKIRYWPSHRINIILLVKRLKLFFPASAIKLVKPPIINLEVLFAATKHHKHGPLVSYHCLKINGALTSKVLIEASRQ